MVKAGIQEGKSAGPKASMYFELPRAKRERYLGGEVQAVRFTALGLCLHDFALAPCPYELNGVRGCADYLRVKGSESERPHLVQIQQFYRTGAYLQNRCQQRPTGDLPSRGSAIVRTHRSVYGRPSRWTTKPVRKAGVVQPFRGRRSRFERAAG